MTSDAGYLGQLKGVNYNLDAWLKKELASELQVAGLKGGLFCNTKTFQEQFRLGGTADQILWFMSMNANPMLQEKDLPLIPVNVRD